MENSYDQHPPGSWWINRDGTVLIQIVSNDDMRIEKVCLINFKYWTGPKINHVEGLSVEEFDSMWILKSR
jgi:hypothetical protein